MKIILIFNTQKLPNNNIKVILSYFKKNLQQKENKKYQLIRRCQEYEPKPKKTKNQN